MTEIKEGSFTAVWMAKLIPGYKYAFEVYYKKELSTCATIGYLLPKVYSAKDKKLIKKMKVIDRRPTELVIKMRIYEDFDIEEMRSLLLLMHKISLLKKKF